VTVDVAIIITECVSCIEVTDGDFEKESDF
jgi:hypothetical protein